MLDNFNPFAKNENLYDSADYSFVNNDKIIGYSEKKVNPSNIYSNFKKEKENGLKNENENENNFINFEKEEKQYEPIKKKIIDFIVKNKLYEKNEAINLKEKILDGNKFLNEAMVDEIFEQIFQYFFK